MKISILMPAYNEKGTIKEIVDKINEVNLKDIKKELLIIDDASTDNTFEIANELAKQYKYIRVIRHKKNGGKGVAIKTGIKYSTGEIIIVQDADMEYDPNDYISLITPIIEGKAKVVYGSRRLRKENKKYSGVSFYLGGIVITAITNLLFNTHITDEPTCYKVFRSDLIKTIPINGNGFEWEPEITAKIARRKIKIYEVPISYYPRSIKEGKKIKWQDGIIAIWTLVKYRII